MANEVFISYSRKDYGMVRSIKQEIDCEVGINCWMDLDGIESGDLFKKVIISAINSHNTVLFMQSYNSMRSEFAMKELNFANSKHKRIILVDIDHFPMTDDFSFDFGDKDNINWSDRLQRTKLINNLKTWFKKGTAESVSNMKTIAQKEQREIERADVKPRPRTPINKDKLPGRNDPCPCGSGKKYKKCCGK